MTTWLSFGSVLTLRRGGGGRYLWALHIGSGEGSVGVVGAARGRKFGSGSRTQVFRVVSGGGYDNFYGGYMDNPKYGDGGRLHGVEPDSALEDQSIASGIPAASLDIYYTGEPSHNRAEHGGEEYMKLVSKDGR